MAVAAVVVVAVVVVAVAVVAVAAAIALSRDGDGEDGESGETPGCPAPDASWTALDVPPSDDTMLSDESDGIELGARVVGGADEIYIGIGVVEGLVVSGFDQGGPVCMHTNTDPQLAPNRRTVATFGFDSTIDAVGVPVVLELFDDVDLVVAEGTVG